MVSVCTVPARGGRSCEHFGGYKTLNRIPLPIVHLLRAMRAMIDFTNDFGFLHLLIRGIYGGFSSLYHVSPEYV